MRRYVYYGRKYKEKIDCVFFTYRLQSLGYWLDVGEIIEKKIQINGEKYPVEAAYGNKAKYTELKASGRQTEDEA